MNARKYILAYWLYTALVLGTLYYIDKGLGIPELGHQNWVFLVLLLIAPESPRIEANMLRKSFGNLLHLAMTFIPASILAIMIFQGPAPATNTHSLNEAMVTLGIIVFDFILINSASWIVKKLAHPDFLVLGDVLQERA